MADSTYQPKVYHSNNGDNLKVASGGAVDVESGGSVQVESGGYVDIESGGLLKIAGTTVSATAAELNRTAGITPGTVAVGKAVVPTTGKVVDELSITLLKIGGVDKTAELAAAVGNPVSGAEASYKIARGTLTPDAGSKTVVAGLTTVVAVVVSLKGDPTINHNAVSATVGDQAGSPAAGSFILKSWKPTAVDNATPTAATGNWVAVDWIAIGT